MPTVNYKSEDYTVLATSELERGQARTVNTNAGKLGVAARSGVRHRVAIIRRNLKLIAAQAAVDARTHGWTPDEIIDFYGLATA